ncbi:MAG: hypothetical protein A2X56_07090 [Nitrospirae bacterium GWC2_57_13]|jgi:hypothetical protein|nr:MAG: hypothetical protein A2X56_07090 [Nitrospirae bacterium GWC2_57_13]OGW43647.1 MAG: hypothetical protein A2X57_00585 [Nitrospirae bacterium GWD2_57_8]
MTGHAEFSVPKDRLRVRMRLRNETAAAGEIFLEHFPGERPVYQRVAALLEDEQSFVPLLEESSGKMLLVNKANIKIVDFADPGDAGEKMGIMHVEQVEAVFATGDALRGELTADVPDERARLSDCLNQRVRFLLLRSEGAICFVNKEALMIVRPAD